MNNIKQMSCKKTFRILLLACTTALGTGAARADYPERPIRIIVPFVAGSSNDILARMTSPLLNKSLGQPFVIVNMPGADARIGIEATMKAPADGYTILFSGSAIALIPALRKNVPYDPLRDVQPIAELGAGPYVIVVNPKVPARNLSELVDLLRKNPGKFNASAGGNTSWMGLILLQIVTGGKVEIISYKGTAPGAQSIVSGETDLTATDASAVVSFIQSGRVRALAVAGDKRLSSLPDVPTTREAGLPEFVAGNAFGVYTRGGTPDAIVHRLNVEINKVIATPEVFKHLVSIGLDPSALSVEQYTQQYRSELNRWKEVVAKAKLPLQD